MLKAPWLRHLAMPFLILLIVSGFYWKLTLTDQYRWIGFPDMSWQVLPWFQFEARAIHNGNLPLWDPHLWMGQSLIGQGQPGVAYPLNWALFLLPLDDDGLIRMSFLNWYYIAIHFMAALFAYWLCRDQECSRAASLIAGCFFSFAAFMGTTDWPQMLNGAVWGPLVFLFLLRAIRGWRPVFSAALGGACLGMAWLSGHHQIPLFTLMAAAGAWLWFFLRQHRPDWRVARLAIIFFAFVFLIGAPQMLPAREYGHLAKRFAGPVAALAWDQPVPYWVHQQYSLSGSSLAGLLVPGVNQAANPFIGVTAFCLALLGIALAWNEPRVRFFSAIALAGLLYSLGSENVLHGILYSLVPLADKARTPSNAIYIFQLGVAVLVAVGIDRFSGDEIVSLWRRRVIVGAVCFGIAYYAILAGFLLSHKLTVDFQDRATLPPFFALLLAALLSAWWSRRVSRPQALFLLFPLMLMELACVAGWQFLHRDDPNTDKYLNAARGNKDIAEFLLQRKGPFRVMIDGEEISGNMGDWYGIDVTGGYVASVNKNILDSDWNSPRFKMLYNSVYALARKPMLPGETDLFTGASGIKVYSNPDAFPRAWTVHRVAEYRTPRELAGLTGNPNFDLRHTAPMKQPFPQMTICDGVEEKAGVSSYSIDESTIDAELACDGMLVVSESYFPGWKATVDGRPAEIREVYGALRGVPLGRGRHTIEMRYRPGSVYLGALLGLAGLIGLTILGTVKGIDMGSKSRNNTI